MATALLFWMTSACVRNVHSETVIMSCYDLNNTVVSRMRDSCSFAMVLPCNLDNRHVHQMHGIWLKIESLYSTDSPDCLGENIALPCAHLLPLR